LNYPSFLKKLKTKKIKKTKKEKSSIKNILGEPQSSPPQKRERRSRKIPKER